MEKVIEKRTHWTASEHTEINFVEQKIGLLDLVTMILQFDDL